MLKKILLSSAVCVALSVSNLSAEPLTIQELSSKYEKQIQSIDTKGLTELLKKHPNTRIIDVRETKDIIKQGGRIKANKVSLITRDKLEFMIANTVNPNETFVVHCYTGNISLLATKALQDMGYKNVLWYKDSFKGWIEAGKETRTPDAYPESMLYSHVKKIDEGVYTSIAELAPPSYENAGHNNNLGFIVGDKGVVVWNASSSYLLARSLHEEIKKITDKPVLYVVLENSQGHAVLGSNYWKEQGAKIVAHEYVIEELKEKGEKIVGRYSKALQDKFLGTKLTLPDITFKDSYTIDLGDKTVEAKYFGDAHEHSDIGLWLPKQKIFMAGDLAFYQRILPVFKLTNIPSWLEVWEKIEAMNPKIVLPGHGDVTDMNHVRVDTKDYIEYLQTSIQKILDDGGDLTDAYKINMSKFEHLDAYEILGKQNIATLWGKMEF